MPIRMLQRFLVLALMCLVMVQYTYALPGVYAHTASAAGVTAFSAGNLPAATPAAITYAGEAWQDTGERGSHCGYCQELPPSLMPGAGALPAIAPDEALTAADDSRHASYVPAVRDRPPRTRS